MLTAFPALVSSLTYPHAGEKEAFLIHFRFLLSPAPPATAKILGHS